MNKEPVAVLAAARAVLVLLAGFGILKLTDAELEQVVTGLAAFYVALEAVFTAWQRSHVTPTDKAANNAAKTVLQETGSTKAAGKVGAVVRSGRLPAPVKR